MGLEVLAVPEDLVVRAVRAVLVVPENLAVPAVLAALVVPEGPVVQAVLAASVVPENLAELVAPVVVLELVLVRVAAPLRTRLATAAHHRGQVAVARVEDLRAAAETTRAQAAAEAATAWAVAG